MFATVQKMNIPGNLTRFLNLLLHIVQFGPVALMIPMYVHDW